MKAETLQDLYLEQLKDLYDAENQLIKALPKMAKAASSAELRNAFEEHLEQTREHAQRIETIFEEMGEKAKGQKCKAMEGLVKDGSEVIEEDMGEGVKDAALIAAAQRVEHYEIAGYGCVRTYANLLGDSEAANLLDIPGLLCLLLTIRVSSCSYRKCNPRLQSQPDRSRTAPQSRLSVTRRNELQSLNRRHL